MAGTTAGAVSKVAAMSRSMADEACKNGVVWSLSSSGRRRSYGSGRWWKIDDGVSVRRGVSWGTIKVHHQNISAWIVYLIDTIR